MRNIKFYLFEKARVYILHIYWEVTHLDFNKVSPALSCPHRQLEKFEPNNGIVCMFIFV